MRAESGLKPRQIFSKLDVVAGEVSHPFPPVDIGSPTLIESFVILALARIIRPKCLLEFGTYTGYTTSILVRNLEDVEVTTIDFPRLGGDLPDPEYSLVSGVQNDMYLTSVRDSRGTPYLDALNTKARNRVREVEMDSTSTEMFRLLENNRFDLFFVDGGHSAETVLSDYKLVEAVASERSICIWHDYGSSLHPDVKAGLDSLSTGDNHFPILGTSLLLSFPARSQLVLEDIIDVGD
jgi:hypothetical protein